MTTERTDTVVGVILARDEEQHIERAVHTMQKVPEVDHVLVVDGHSTDRTRTLAAEAGAEVVLQHEKAYPGKGIAIQTALDATDQDILVFFDADIHTMRPEMVERLVEPVLMEAADHTVATYERIGGRVTTLTARPLLDQVFPEVRVSQPLTGEFATRRAALESCTIDPGWGAGIGILIDLVMNGHRVQEVDLGYMEHDMRPLAALAPMAEGVVATVVDRAGRYNRWGTMTPVTHGARDIVSVRG